MLKSHLIVISNYYYFENNSLSTIDIRGVGITVEKIPSPLRKKPNLPLPPLFSPASFQPSIFFSLARIETS